MRTVSFVLFVFILRYTACKLLIWSLNNTLIKLPEPLAGVSYGLTSNNDILYVFGAQKAALYDANTTILKTWTIRTDNNGIDRSIWDTSDYLQTPDNKPIYCQSQCCVTISNEIYIIGQQSKFIYKLNTASEKWTLYSAFYNLVSQSCVVTDNKQIFMFSGYYMQTYDISTGDWIIGSLQSEYQVFGASCVYYGNTKSIYIFGGKTGIDDSYLISQKIFTMTTDYNTWHQMESILTAPRYGSSAIIVDNKIYIIGGIIQDYNLTEYSVNTVDIFNPMDDTLTNGTSMNYDRSYPIVFFNNSRIYVCGGQSALGDLVWSNCEISNILIKNEVKSSNIIIIIYVISISISVILLLILTVYVIRKYRKSKHLNIPLVTINADSDVGYVKLEEQFNHFTKHNKYGLSVLFSCLLFCIAWIVWIIYNLTKYGIYSSYCNEEEVLCDDNFWTTCCDESNNVCVNKITLECSTGTQTLSSFIIQIVLICLITYYIYSIIKSLTNGIEIQMDKQIVDEIDDNKLLLPFKKIIKFKKYLQSKRVDCRKYIYEEKYDTTKSSVQFLYRSTTLLVIFKFIGDIPGITLNLFSNQKNLQIIGLISFVADIFIIALSWFMASRQEKFHCGCKKYNDEHFPLQHRSYASVTGGIIMLSATFSIGPAWQQINLLSDVNPTNEYHSWLKCINVILAVNSIVTAMKLYWCVYYLLCFYWSRYSVNTYEHNKIKSILENILIGAYIFKISIDEKDEFVTVDENEQIAETVYIKSDCFSCCTIYCGTFNLIWIGILLLWATTELNNSYNLI